MVSNFQHDIVMKLIPAINTTSRKIHVPMFLQNVGIALTEMHRQGTSYWAAPPREWMWFHTRASWSGCQGEKGCWSWKIVHTLGDWGFLCWFSFKRHACRRFQPFWKISYSQIGSFPQVKVKIKNVWNHHLACFFSRQFRQVSRQRVLFFRWICPWQQCFYLTTHVINRSWYEIPALPSASRIEIYDYVLG